MTVRLTPHDDVLESVRFVDDSQVLTQNVSMTP